MYGNILGGGPKVVSAIGVCYNSKIKFAMCRVEGVKRMKERMLQLIREEDPKNPLTDEELADKLQVFRENITVLRKEAGIPNSAERRKPIVSYKIEEFLKEDIQISDRKLTRLLEQEGFVIGKYTVGKLKAELLEKMRTEDRGKAENEPKKEQINIFHSFIGYDGSVKQQILKAQAAILYPPKGLHCLIYGPSGVGKSYLAELMHRYACGTDNFGETPPFFEFNCADYADNPHLLLAQLFGYCKGSFTGAEKDHKGIVELCNGGILFLDEVHRLPPEGQEILFQLMDKGKFRRLGEADTQRESHLMVIAATTENPMSSLLLTFRRRIPMSIEIPPLKERPASERLEFIRHFFQQESRQLGRELVVKEEVLQCFMSCEYAGNVGQVKSDVQVCCAKAFLESKRRQTEGIEIRFHHLSESVKREYEQNTSLEKKNPLIQGDLYLFPEDVPEGKGKVLMKSLDIYGKLERSYDQMKQEGVNEEEIKTWLTSEIEAELTKNIRQIEKSRFSSDEMENIVGAEVIKITKDIYSRAIAYFPDLKEELVCPLAVHLWMALQRNAQGVQAVRDRIYKFREKYMEEYEAAEKILHEICEKYYLTLREEEVSFLAMYFNRFRSYREEEKKERIGVLVVSHGSVARGMAEVANAILGTNHAKGLEMNLMDSPSSMIEKVVRMAETVDQGKGIVILADMGSLMQVGDVIRDRLGIPVGIVGRTDTLMVIEAVRRTLWTDDSIEQIVDALDIKKTVLPMELMEKRKQPAILCLCITGEGAARVLKGHIQERLMSSLNQIQIITKGYIEDADISQIIRRVEDEYEILAIVGTIDPEQNKYPFISASRLYLPEGISSLRKILKRHHLQKDNQLNEVISEAHIYIRKNGYKDDILDEMISCLSEEGYVKNEFLLSVYKRESMMTTILKGGIAIPHGSSEFVTKPVISVTKLDTPIAWDGVNMVDLIFVLALDEKSKKYFEQLYRIISDEFMISALRECQNPAEIEKILCRNTKSDK